ncbi:MAG: ATP-binding protein [Candidatus Woesearchaeota archaeon]
MDTENLKRIIHEGEGSEVEFKQSFHSFQEVAKIVCAFANTAGGILTLGVSDNGMVAGVREDLDSVQQKISQCSRTIQPNPVVGLEVHTIDKKKLVVVVVHKADSSVFHTVGGVIYVRIGSTIQKLDGQSIVEFLRNRQILLFEESLETSATLEDIDIAKVSSYLELRKQADYLKMHSLEEFLVNRRLASLQPVLRIKNSALLFFSKYLQSFFPYAQIKLVRFDGNEPIKVLAYEEAGGSLPQVIEQSLNFVRRFVAKEFVISGAKRKETHILPEEAFREAVINAVAHRDYFNKNEIQLSIFDDRLEITNPGGLPEGMTRELLGVLSIQRNPVIYQFLKDYGYMEGIGSGISKIFKAMKDSQLGLPEFVSAKGFFRIVLPIRKGLAFTEFNKRQLRALEYLRMHKRMKAKEYSSINSVSIPTALKDIKELEKKKYLKKIGSYRGAYYVLVEE